MSEIKPKKERRFLKTLGRVGEILVEQVLLKLGSNLIKKIGGKKTLPSILFIFLSFTLFAQYPNTGNKQRLGFQTTGDGLVWRGSLSDTASIQPINNQNAWVILDTVNLKFYSFDFTSNVWNLVGGAPGLTMPFDSITFNTAKDGTVGVGEVEYNDTQGSLIQGLKGGLVTNVIGQQLHQRVNNRTGATLNKGDVVYLSGSQGNRITVAKAIATSDPTSANTFGIVAEQILNNASGYIITEGLITNINTSALTQDSAVYLSGTTSGALTSTKPQAPIHGVYIGVCVKTNAGSGEVFVKIRNGQELDELHDVQISNPTNNASLYFKSSEGLWRDTTAVLLVSDTASMLTPYFRDADTSLLNLTSRFAAKLNLSDTASMLTNYLRTGTAASTYLPLTGGTMTGTINRQEGSHDGSANTFYYNLLNYFAKRDNNKGNQTAQITFTDRPGTSTFPNNVRTSDIYLMTAKNFSSGQLGQYLDTTLSVVANQDGGRVGISKLNPAYKLDVNGTLGVTGETTLLNKTFVGNFTDNTPTSGGNHNIRLESNDVSSIGFHDAGNTIANIRFSAANGFVIGASDGLYGPHSTTIAGNATLSAPLTVNSSAVFNEAATDSDFRVESEANAHMLFVDASTSKVGIGYASPTKTLDVNGTLGVFGATNLSNTLTVDGKTILNDSARFEGNILFKKNMGLPIVKISNADYTATTYNHTIIYTTLTSDKTLTIPNASDAVGVKFIISIFDIPEGNEALTLVTPSSNLFVRTDGENSSVDIVGGYCTTIQSDGTKWYILSYAPMY
jgi:hypothetical protein